MNTHYATAKVIQDSISREGHRLTTFQLRYWRPIHSELMTHRVFSRNAGSSRARPSMTIINQVHSDPWGPVEWGLNEPGMQASKIMSPEQQWAAEKAWKDAAQQAAHYANKLVALGAHKQIVNRLLEPFGFIDVLVTSTEYANWFHLRDEKQADPSIRNLAQVMKTAYEDSTPIKLESGEWHLPYIDIEDWGHVEVWLRTQHPGRFGFSQNEVLQVLMKVSAARCARISYKLFDGSTATIEKDMELFTKLLGAQPLHASPAEHQATPDEYVNSADPDYHGWQNKGDWGNFTGWIQHRKLIPGEYMPG